VRTLILAALAGCTAEVPPSDPVPRGEPPLLDALCTVDPFDPLRALCRMVLTEPLVAEIEVTDGEETAVFTTNEPSVTPVLPIWGLTADSDWSWTARAGDVELTGTFHTGVLPIAMDELTLASTGTVAQLVQVISPVDCVGGGWVAVFDAQGRVRWYADSGGTDVDLVQLTEADTVVWIVDRTHVTEVDLTGRVLLSRDDLGLPLHHDVFRRDDLVYVLVSDDHANANGVTYVEDIVLALDRDGQEVWRWDEHDHLDPTTAHTSHSPFWHAWFPGATDAWHTNALYVTDDGYVLLSLQAEDTILRVSIADGSIGWILGGNRVDGAFESSFDLVLGREGNPGFGNQHHVALLDDGHLTVFDNANDRGLELALDEAEGKATFVQDWDLGLHCPIQSSVFPLAEDGRLVTCADQHTLGEFDATGTELGRHVLACRNHAKLPRTTRGQPVDLWDGATAAGVTATRVW
jgi:hypothetical protein